MSWNGIRQSAAFRVELYRANPSLVYIRLDVVVIPYMMDPSATKISLCFAQSFFVNRRVIQL